MQNLNSLYSLADTFRELQSRNDLDPAAGELDLIVQQWKGDNNA